MIVLILSALLDIECFVQIMAQQLFSDHFPTSDIHMIECSANHGTRKIARVSVFVHQCENSSFHNSYQISEPLGNP